VKAHDFKSAGCNRRFISNASTHENGRPVIAALGIFCDTQRIGGGKPIHHLPPRVAIQRFAPSLAARDLEQPAEEEGSCL
jgi:hypothetical protein